MTHHASVCQVNNSGELGEWREFALAMWAKQGENADSFEAKLQKLENENQKLRTLISQQNEVLDYYSNSFSWRITAPLRALRKPR